MILESGTNAIRTAIESWATTNSYSIGYDNLAFEKPDEALHGRVSIIAGDTVQADMGVPRRWRTAGTVMLRIFSPIDKGEQSIYQMIDSFSQTMSSTTLSGIVVTRSTRSNRVGRSGKWWQWNVTLPWYMDYTE